MLKLCTDAGELAFLPADPFCAKITALAQTYGFERGFAMFYVQSGAAALSRVDGCVTLYCGEDADFEEISGFLGFLGFDTLQCSEDVMKKLGLTPVRSSYIVKYKGEPAPVPRGFSSRFDAREIHSLLSRSGFETGTFEAFAESVCLRLAKGTAAFGCIEENGSAVSCAFRLFEGEKSVLLGAVATDAACRGRGLAGALVPCMAQNKKPSFLFCRNDGLLDFYKKCGFALWGRWAETDGVIK